MIYKTDTKKTDAIKRLIDKHVDKIKESQKGKIEINFSGKHITFSIMIFDEETE